MARYFKTILLQCGLLMGLFFSGAATSGELNFALLVFNGEQRNAYFQQVKAFEKENPSIRVNIQALESEQYKKKIESWLSAPRRFT